MKNITNIGMPISGNSVEPVSAVLRLFRIMRLMGERKVSDPTELPPAQIRFRDDSRDALLLQWQEVAEAISREMGLPDHTRQPRKEEP